MVVARRWWVAGGAVALRGVGGHTKLAHGSMFALRRVAEVADADEQDGVGVRGCVDELQIVAGVPPAARRVDPHAQRREVAFEGTFAVDLGVR